MENDLQQKTHRQLMSPLGVISLFVSLTEIVTGIAVIQASGYVQTALTTFVIIFPLLVAGGFFFILWNRPYVFYPPTDFTKGIDVQQYVSAMSPGTDSIKADLQAEVANVRANIEIETEVYNNRIKEMEVVLEKTAAQTNDAKKAFDDYQISLKNNLKEEENTRTAFDYRSQFRIHVTTVTEEAPTKEQSALTGSISNNLQDLGYKTSTGGLGSFRYFSKYKEQGKWNRIIIIFKDGAETLAEEIKNHISPDITVPVEIISVEDVKNDGNNPGHDISDGEVDVTIAYCLT